MSASVAMKVERILKEGGYDHSITEHNAVFTSEEAADVRGVDLRTGVKAMLLKTKDGKFLMALCPGDKRLDLKKIAGKAGTKRLSLAPREDVVRLTDCEPGSVPPFGHAAEVETYMDKEILDNENVNFNIGLHERSASMKSKDLNNIVKPTIF
jgi:Ala-tRNA(Pro) deacylase